MDVTSAAVPASLELLGRLIAFPTVSRDSNLGVIEFVQAHLQAAGALTRLTYDDDRRWAPLATAVSFFRGTLMWCRSMVSSGAATRLCWRSAMVVSAGVVAPT